jgi:hypothetical protein
MQTSTNSTPKVKFKPRTTSPELQPDAPEGGWTARVVKGKSKVLTTKAGDPRLVMTLKLEKAHEDENEKFQGVEVQFAAIIYDDNDATKSRAANINKRDLRAFIEGCGGDFADVYPTSVASDEDFEPIIEACEGQTLDVWTVHDSYKANSGETVNQVKVQFRKPGSASLINKDDEDETPAPRGAKGKKPGRR